MTLKETKRFIIELLKKCPNLEITFTELQTVIDYKVSSLGYNNIQGVYIKLPHGNPVYISHMSEGNRFRYYERILYLMIEHTKGSI